MNLDNEQIQAAVVDKVAADIVANANWDAETRRMINAKIDEIFSKQTAKLVENEIERAFNDAFEREYRKGGDFGVPGEKTTIRKEVHKMVSDYWSEKVDSRGKPTNSSFNSVTRAEWLMAQISTEKFSSYMKQQCVNMTAEIKDLFTDELHAGLSRTMDELFRVRTNRDKERESERTANKRAKNRQSR